MKQSVKYLDKRDDHSPAYIDTRLSNELFSFLSFLFVRFLRFLEKRKDHAAVIVYFGLGEVTLSQLLFVVEGLNVFVE